MVLTRPELELKRRAPLAGGQPGTHEFVRVATIVVGFGDTCDFRILAARALRMLEDELLFP